VATRPTGEAPSVLVLGATGFIGGHIARAALEHGWRVRALRRRPGAVGAIGDVAQRVEWVQGELPFQTFTDSDDLEGLRNAIRGCDVVFHAAAAYPRAERDVAGWINKSVRQMRAVLQAASSARVSRFIYTSTLTTIGSPGESGRLADERDFYVPGSARSVYYESKFAMELEAFRAAAEGLPVVILNPTAVFGPGDIKPTTGEVLLRVAKGQIPVYFDATVNAVDVRDVAAAHVIAAERGRMGQRYILGGHNLTLQELLTTTAQVAGVPPPRRKLPMQAVNVIIRLSDGLRLPLPDLIKTLRLWQPLNSEKAQRELLLVSRPFKDTARDTIAWFRQRHYV
jgi:dihydroflavonol-4-reductase